MDSSCPSLDEASYGHTPKTSKKPTSKCDNEKSKFLAELDKFNSSVTCKLCPDTQITEIYIFDEIKSTCYQNGGPTNSILSSVVGNQVLYQYVLAAQPTAYANVHTPSAQQALNLALTIVVWRKLYVHFARNLPVMNVVVMRYIMGQYVESSSGVAAFLDPSAVAKTHESLALVDRLLLDVSVFACNAVNTIDFAGLRKVLPRMAKQYRSFKNGKRLELRLQDLVCDRPDLQPFWELIAKPLISPITQFALVEGGYADEFCSLGWDKLCLQARGSKGSTLLHCACKRGSVPMVNYLISCGAGVDTTNHNKHTPLHVACAKGHMHCVVALIAAGADVNGDPGQPCSPLQAAITGRHWNIVGLLLARGVPTEEITPKQRHVLSLVCHLNLSGCNLATLSPNLAVLEGLTELNVSNNQFVLFDFDWLSKLHRLKRIVVDGNELIGISANLGNLCGLAAHRRGTIHSISSSNRNLRLLYRDQDLLRSRSRGRSSSAIDVASIPRSLSLDSMNQITSRAPADEKSFDKLDLTMPDAVVDYFNSLIADDSPTKKRISLDAFVTLHGYLVHTTALVAHLFDRLRSELPLAIVPEDAEGVTPRLHSGTPLIPIEQLFYRTTITRNHRALKAGIAKAHANVVERLTEAICKLFMIVKTRPDMQLMQGVIEHECRQTARHHGNAPADLKAIASERPVGDPRNLLSERAAEPEGLLEFSMDLDSDKDEEASLLSFGFSFTSLSCQNMTNYLLTDPPANHLHLLTKPSIPVEALATALTSYQYDIFRSIPSHEWLHKNCFKRSLSPVYHKLIDSNNTLSQWLVTAVLSSRSLVVRLDVLERAIRIGMLMYTYGNLFGMAGVYSGLTSFPIHRLRLTMGLLSADAKKALELFEMVVSYKRNFKTYRSVLASLSSPAIPLLFPEVRDLTYLEEMETFTPGVNTSKLSGIWNVFSTIKRLSVDVAFTGQQLVAQLSSLVAELFTDKSLYFSENEQQERSFAIEPRCGKTQQRAIAELFHEEMKMDELEKLLQEARAQHVSLVESVHKQVHMARRGSQLGGVPQKFDFGSRLRLFDAIGRCLAHLQQSNHVVEAIMTDAALPGGEQGGGSPNMSFELTTSAVETDDDTSPIHSVRSSQRRRVKSRRSGMSGFMGLRAGKDKDRDGAASPPGSPLPSLNLSVSDLADPPPPVRLPSGGSITAALRKSPSGHKARPVSSIGAKTS